MDLDEHGWQIIPESLCSSASSSSAAFASSFSVRSNIKNATKKKSTINAAAAAAAFTPSFAVRDNTSSELANSSFPSSPNSSSKPSSHSSPPVLLSPTSSINPFNVASDQNHDDEEYIQQLLREERETIEKQARLRKEREAEEERQWQELVQKELTCISCHKLQADAEDVIEISERCGHRYCKACLRTSLLLPSRTNWSCLAALCNQIIPSSAQRKALSRSEIEAVETRFLEQVMDANSKDFFKCPNCCTPYAASINSSSSSSSTSSSSSSIEQAVVDGVKLSIEHSKHRATRRFLCPFTSCAKDFCRDCDASPYHNGYTCEEFKRFKDAVKCRFCGEPIIPDHLDSSSSSSSSSLSSSSSSSVASHPASRKKRISKKEREKLNAQQKQEEEAAAAARALQESSKLTPVCRKEECQQRLATACDKILSCQHPCCGVKRETSCLGCLVPECPNNYAQAEGEDYCNICFVEGINQAPSIKLACSHVFHAHCLQKRIESRWSSTRIHFSYLNCPLCAQEIQHPYLDALLRPHLERKRKVYEKSLQRLKIEGAENDSALKAGGRYYQEPQKYALDRFAYYECNRCKEPYFGGKRACEGLQADAEQQQQHQGADVLNGNAAADLICPACVAKVSGVSGCVKHGSDYVSYKCRFCCSIANWFCFGTTHFCEKCHSRQQNHDYITRYTSDKLQQCIGGSSCPLNIPSHPQAPAEFSLGCAICAYERDA